MHHAIVGKTLWQVHYDKEHLMLNSPSIAQWRQLYALADRIKEMAPWENLYEDELFGVSDPLSGEDYFISVMGQGGDHYAVGVYAGALALYQFWAVHEADSDEMAMQMLLSIRQLQLSFEDRENLDAYDRTVIKQLGRKYRGRAAWPVFRSFKPGYLPWRLDAAEADVLIRTLEQAAEVLARISVGESLPEPENDESYLMRIPETQAGSVIWREQMMRIPPPSLPELKVQLDIAKIEAARKLPKQRTLELDIATLPEPVADEEGRPFLAEMLLVVDNKSGIVLASELLPNGETPAHTLVNALYVLLDTLIRWGWTPATLYVRHEMAKELLAPLAAMLGIKLKIKSQLPMLDEALGFMLASFGGEWMEDFEDDEDDNTPPPVRHRGLR